MNNIYINLSIIINKNVN